MEQETIQELRREFNRIEASLEKDINEAKSLVTSLNDAASQLKKCEGNMAQEFVCIKSLQKQAATREEVEKLQRMKTDETVCFTTDQSIATFLQQRKTLGTVSIDKPKTKVSISKQEDQTFTPKDGLYRVKKQREINVKLQQDRCDCYIYGSCVTEDGSLLLADYWNQKLKCVDLSTDKVKAYIDLPAGPLDVCTISKTEAAVTLQNRSVQFVSLGDKMTSTRTLTMKHNCLGLYHQDGRLFITDNAQTLYICDLIGQVQNIITTDGFGKKIFQFNQHIVVSDRGDKVFAADSYKGVVVLDSQGNNLSSLSDNNVSDCRGICTVGRNVFVSGNKTNNIVQFGQDFRMLGEIGKVTSPSSLCFDQHKKQLIVTHGYYNNNITVLELT